MKTKISRNNGRSLKISKLLLKSETMKRLLDSDLSQVVGGVVNPGTMYTECSTADAKCTIIVTL